MGNHLTIEQLDEGVNFISKFRPYENFYEHEIKIEGWEKHNNNLFCSWIFHEGFIKYTDIQNVPGYFFVNFTNKGRKLIHIGSYSGYIEMLKRKEESVRLQQDFIKSQSLFAEMQNELMPLLKESNKSTIRTNKILIWVFSITMFLTGLQIAVTIFSMNLQYNNKLYMLQLKQLQSTQVKDTTHTSIQVVAH
jgi:hypothetical protein